MYVHSMVLLDTENHTRIKNKKEILEDSNRVLKDKKISEIYLTGSGSSYNAAVAVADFAKKLLGIRVTPVYPVMLIEDYELISKSAVVTGISQQGTSAAVIKALDDVIDFDDMDY